MARHYFLPTTNVDIPMPKVNPPKKDETDTLQQRFIKFVKTEYGQDIHFKKSDDPDTFIKLFGYTFKNSGER